MGAVIVSLEPSQPRMLLAGIRDQLPHRPWQPPGRHWPELPLLGGTDELTGGTWLAVHPAIPRVACVVDGRGQHAPQPFRRSRGELPLLAGAGGWPALERLDPAAYDPFHLVVADIASAWVLSWNGVRESRISLGAGTYAITDVGVDPRDPRAKRFAAALPAADPAAAPGAAWGEWPALAAGAGPVSYVAFSPSGTRYDFEPAPGQIIAVA
jgi:hypothetical protein